ncbi:putative pumilio homolog 8, chloroplastic [Abrus precatorius]|uniref:Pumilio homolog 8, chloroplastic n=1 Tax=Abrus precatorius TaxID=3816 RepID=A0A8B8MHF4_ABRPR|nr:putative pumilio homolog 8, chloroplastic [Abrus precatorius]
MSSSRNPCFVENDYSTSLLWSFQRQRCPGDGETSQNRYQNPILTNQTLEDAFSRLSVMPNNHSTLGFVGEGSSHIDTTKPFTFQGQETYPSNYHCSRIGQMHSFGNGRYSGGDNTPVLATTWHNCYVGYNNDTDRYNGGYHNLRSQAYNTFLKEESQNNFLRLPLSNDDQFSLSFQGSRSSSMSTGLLSNTLDNVNSWRYRLLQNPLTQHSVYDFQGKILLLAKDQLGCRVLQETMKSLKSQEEVSLVFLELIDHVIELMLDSSGNYVFQKLVEICTEEQRTHIILMLTKTNFQLVNICLDAHGTRAVQKLFEHVTTQEQRNLIMLALYPGVVALTKDTNGLHVIENCLKHFSLEDNKYILNIMANNCVDIATDKNGCCVMQRCVERVHGESKERLMAEIILNAFLLAENCYGNYVVQHLVTQKIPRVIEGLMRQLENNFFTLSYNKYGSNVVEKFLQVAGEEHSKRIVVELLCDPNVSILLVDPYGNYVIKSALHVSKGAIRNALLQLVEDHYALMQSNLYGQKLLAWVDKWKHRKLTKATSLFFVVDVDV